MIKRQLILCNCASISSAIARCLVKDCLLLTTTTTLIISSYLLPLYLLVQTKSGKADAKQAEAIWRFREITSESTDLQDDTKAALEKLANGPIQCFVNPECCKVLEELSKESKEALFAVEDAETSILIKRAPLVLGSDVQAHPKKQRSSKTTPQGTEKWKSAAAELLVELRRLLTLHVGGAWVLLDKFDYGPQVLFALAQRQRTHGDGLSFFISGLLQFNMYAAVLQII